MRAARWEIRPRGGLPYDPFDYTHACDKHVGTLLQTFDAHVFEVFRVEDDEGEKASCTGNT
jgi:hypothetical protein